MEGKQNTILVWNCRHHKLAVCHTSTVHVLYDHTHTYTCTVHVHGLTEVLDKCNTGALSDRNKHHLQLLLQLAQTSVHNHNQETKTRLT